MANINLIEAQQEVVSIENIIKSILGSESVGTFQNARRLLLEQKTRLFEILRKTQQTDTDDLLSVPVSSLVQEIDAVIQTEKRPAERKSD